MYIISSFFPLQRIYRFIVTISFMVFFFFFLNFSLHPNTNNLRGIKGDADESELTAILLTYYHIEPIRVVIKFEIKLKVIQFYSLFAIIKY